jgi:hypothetical protein
MTNLVMFDDNVLPFPVPDGEMRWERRMAEGARLAEEVVDILHQHGAPTDFRSIIAKLELAGANLKQIGDLILTGSELLRAGESRANIAELTRRTNQLLDIIAGPSGRDHAGEER